MISWNNIFLKIWRLTAKISIWLISENSQGTITLKNQNFLFSSPLVWSRNFQIFQRKVFECLQFSPKIHWIVYTLGNRRFNVSIFPRDYPLPLLLFSTTTKCKYFLLQLLPTNKINFSFCSFYRFTGGIFSWNEDDQISIVLF